MTTLFAMHPRSDGLEEWLEVLPRWRVELDRRLAEAAAWQVQQEEQAAERLPAPPLDEAPEPPVVPPLRPSTRRPRRTGASPACMQGAEGPQSAGQLLFERCGIC